jgi:hypothetical protein
MIPLRKRVTRLFSQAQSGPNLNLSDPVDEEIRQVVDLFHDRLFDQAFARLNNKGIEPELNHALSDQESVEEDRRYSRGSFVRAASG